MVYCDKWNKYYHSNSFKNKDIYTCNIDTSPAIIEEFNLQLGEKYVIQPKLLLLVMSGDGFDIYKSNASSGLVALIKPHIFEHRNLQQTLQICIPWMISGKSHYDPLIAELYDQESTKLGTKGSLAFKSNKKN